MKKITTLLLMLLLMATAANAKYTYWGYAGKAAVDLPYGSIGTPGQSPTHVVVVCCKTDEKVRSIQPRRAVHAKTATRKFFIREANVFSSYILFINSID